MLEKLQNKLKTAVNFPSPPAVAQQIIDLASDPDIDVVKVATAMSKDPGLTAKVLRIANSSLYSKQRRSENLRQALVVLGLNAATTLALSFSLVGTYKTVKGSEFDYAGYWRRAILGASAARTFGELKRVAALEDIFLAALLQDIAILAIDRVQADFYCALPPHALHADFITYEIERLGIDHAAVGAWLLTHWRLPESLCRTVGMSHAPLLADVNTKEGLGARCIALGSACAEILLSNGASADLGALSTQAAEWLGIDSQTLGASMERIVALIPETEKLFDTALVDADACAAILEQARELLMIRNLQSIQQVSALQKSSEHFEARTAELEDKHRRDPLTGVYNRGHLDFVLDAEFRSAVTGGWPLSVFFADLDWFKRVNDTYGHPVGDSVLIATARIILDVVRDTDCVARYGGEEFLIIFPGLGSEAAKKIGERLLLRLRTFHHAVPGGSLQVTASLGLATHHPGSPFRSAAHLLEAADRSVYAAKRLGRDRLEFYDTCELAVAAG